LSTTSGRSSPGSCSSAQIPSIASSSNPPTNTAGGPTTVVLAWCTGRVRAPRAERLQAIALLERCRRAASCLAELAVIKVTSRSMPTHPDSSFHRQPWNALRAASRQVPDPGSDLRSGFADPFLHVLAEAGEGPPDGGLRRRVTEDEALMGEQPDVGHAGRTEHDRDANKTRTVRRPCPSGLRPRGRTMINPLVTSVRSAHLLSRIAPVYPTRPFRPNRRPALIPTR
jgi:hypothetical protein